MRKNLSVRAILFDQAGQLVLIKRTRPNIPTYWVLPGGGVEDIDDNLESALTRELMEELGAEIVIHQLVLELEYSQEEKAYFFTCLLQKMNLALRNGPEFADVSRGQYDIEMIDFKLEGIKSLEIKPSALKDFLIEYHEDIQGNHIQHTIRQGY